MHYKYGATYDKFISYFPPQHIEKYTRQPERCYFGDAPTLSAVSAAYGPGTATSFIIAQITYLSEYSGVKHITVGQIDTLSALIASEYHYLRVTEIMLFLRRFMLGHYGHFFGQVDPLVITNALRTFITERAEAYTQHEKELAAQERQTYSIGAVTRQEYETIRQRAANGDSEAQKLLTPPTT